MEVEFGVCCLRVLFMRVELVDKVGVDAQIADERMVSAKAKTFFGQFAGRAADEDL